MADDMDVLRKQAQEVEIDHLLAEEFACDADFGRRFLLACGFEHESFVVNVVSPEPSLGGDGFGDIYVDGQSSSHRIALLIEDKITAGPAVRQAARYRQYADVLRSNGFDVVYTILVAPYRYRGERNNYDAYISLEDVVEIIDAESPVRLAYRRDIIRRALKKSAATGVKLPDERLLALKSAYISFCRNWVASDAAQISFPDVRDSYYDGDAWIDPILDPRLPPNITIRHRLWTSIHSNVGKVDLIIRRPSEVDLYRFEKDGPRGAVKSPFSKGKGVTFSLDVPRMDQNTGFDPSTADLALRLMQMLADWYLEARVARD